MTDQIRAPWTPEQVAALNRFQREGGMHPFTCGYEHPAHPNPILQATKNGWRCYVIGCDWEQDWAHAFMADPNAWPKFPFSFEERERTGRNAGLIHPQDGPQAPQDGPQRPDAGAETPDGAGGRQTGAGGGETLRDRIDVADWDHHFAAGKGFRPADRAEMGLLTEQVQPQPGQRALDVGCGLGGYAAQLAGLGYETLAVDWAGSSIAAVRDRYTGVVPGLEARHVDFEDDQAVAASIPAGAFSLVTMRLVFAFMADKPAAAARVRGLLAPGGAWVVTTLLAEHLPPERAHIGLTRDDVGALTERWGRGCWYDLEPNGLRCFVLRP